jgi:glycosyltransferase involved in cell wall biosynthesis
MVEAMACGVPVISTNACFAEILPQKLIEMLYIPDNNFKQQAEALHRLLSLDDNSLNELGIELRDIVVREHDIGQLIEKILSVIVNS